MNTSYKEISDRFLNRIKSYDFYSMAEVELYDIIYTYLPDAIEYYENCKQDLEDRDDELLEFNFALTGTTKTNLVGYMVVVWLENNFINTQSHLKTQLTSSDFKSYDPKNMLAKVTEVRDKYLETLGQRTINKSYKDSKLFDIVKKR